MRSELRRIDNIDDWQDIDRYLAIGEILIMSGKVTEKALHAALELQKTRTEYVGELLIMLDALSREDLELGLALQVQINSRFSNKKVLR